ncbi:MAG: hypothetical protein Q8N83_08440 [Ignavibacteria bacterium]|nr:hypothetical protein [Ignavibacteria bacterium]
MKYHIRKVKTGSGYIAVQVIKYENRKRVVVKHVGSAQTKEEITILRNNAADRISEQTEQISLFPTQEEHFISLEQYEYLGFQYTFLYETLHKLQARLGYTCFGSKLL